MIGNCPPAKTSKPYSSTPGSQRRRVERSLSSFPPIGGALFTLPHCRGDSFLARLPAAEFELGMAALRAHGDEIDQDASVTEDIDWFIFTKQA